MKILHFFPIAVLSLALPCLSADERADSSQDLKEWQQEFLNLPEDRREEFGKHLNKARDLFQQKRIFETIDELGKAETIFPESPDVQNLLGACQTEFRDFEKAMKHFKRADELNPGDSRILFNIAEIHFVSGNWDDAEKALAQVMTMIGTEGDLQLRRLIEFKLLLSKLKLDKTEEAEALAGKYDEFDDSPFPYYAEAAIAYEGGDEVKAQAAMARARRIFRKPELLSPWQDTMMEYGYIKSFFGGLEGEEDETPE